MCDCISYNRPDLCPVDGKTSVVLTPPAWSSKTGICVDACIADAVKMLWDNGIVTGGCCCGHNGAFGYDGPSVVLGEDHQAAEAIKLLKEKDGRAWKVLQWRIMEMGEDGKPIKEYT